MFDLSGQCILITGASGNLGSAAVELFAKAGATLALVDRSEEKLRERYASLLESGTHQAFGIADLCDRRAVDALLTDVVARCGKLDGVFNTVGAYRGGSAIAEDDWSTWAFCIDVNVKTAFELSRAAAGVMRNGSITHVISRNAFAAAGNYAAYSAAKAALLRLSEALADELRPQGVRVNCVVPGTLDTPQNRAGMPNAPESKFVAPAAVASVALFLASGGASAVTGAAIPAYGCK